MFPHERGTIRVGFGARVVLVTLDAQDVLACDRTSVTHHSAFPVTVVDTTGAGDAFNGGLAVALAPRLDILKGAALWSSRSMLTPSHAASQGSSSPSFWRAWGGNCPSTFWDTTSCWGWFASST